MSNASSRHHFLDALEPMLAKQPGPETKLELLRLATPSLDESVLTDRAETRKAYRALMIGVHPDRHPKEIDRATRLCQDVKIYYERCGLVPYEPTPSKKKRRKSGVATTECSPKESTAAAPIEFSSEDEWPHVTFDFAEEDKRAVESQRCAEVPSCLVAYQCINARGGVVHGKRVQRWYSGEHATKKSKHTAGASQVFGGGFGGTKTLRGADEIKEEIATRGPVVWVNSRQSSLLRHQKELLVVGWTSRAGLGEVWIVKPFASASVWTSTTAHVPIGQFGEEERCVAPVDSLEQVTWEEGPYFDICTKGVAEWRTNSTSLCYIVANFGDLEPLLKYVGPLNFMNAKVAPGEGEHPICIRDKNKRAHTRKGVLRSIQWIDNKWKVTVDF